eukprot:7751647-Pyramimonas_sp.AAC.1
MTRGSAAEAGALHCLQAGKKRKCSCLLVCHLKWSAQAAQRGSGCLRLDRQQLECPNLARASEFVLESTPVPDWNGDPMSRTSSKRQVRKLFQRGHGSTKKTVHQ